MVQIWKMTSFHSKKYVISLLLHILNCQYHAHTWFMELKNSVWQVQILTFHQYLVYPPCTRTTASRRLIIPWINLWIWFWGILFHSSCKTAVNSLRIWTGGSHWRTRRPKMSHRCSMGLRSGLIAGHGMVSTAFCCKKLKELGDSKCSVRPGIVIHEDGSGG